MSFVDRATVAATGPSNAPGRLLTCPRSPGDIENEQGFRSQRERATAAATALEAWFALYVLPVVVSTRRLCLP